MRHSGLADGGERVAGPAGALDVVHPHDAAAPGDAEGRRADGSLAPLGELQIEDLAEECLVGRGEQQRVAERGEGRRRAQKGQRLLRRLAEVEAGIEHDALGGDAGGAGAGGPVGEEAGHVVHDVVVVRVGVGHPRREPDVRDHHRGAVLGRGRRVVGVGQAADVVAHHRALGVRGAGHRGPPGVDRDGRVEARGQAGHDGDDAVELLGLGDLGAGARLDPADVEDVGAVGHQLLGPGVELVELEGGPLVVEGVGRAVEDPHDERPVGQVVAAAAEVERGGERGQVGGGRSARRGARPGHQNSRAASARRYSLVRGSSAPIASRRSTNSWRAASSSRTRSSSSSSLASISSRPAPETSTPASSRRASAARARPVSVSGRRASSASASAGLAPVDQQAGQRLGGAGVVGLELERPAQRGLVARRNERVGLAGRRRQALHERGHLGLGQRADELVHHLAVARWRRRRGWTAPGRSGRSAGSRRR